MKNINLCLKCSEFPCICGDQYTELTSKQLGTLIPNLLDLWCSKTNITEKIKTDMVHTMATIERATEQHTLFDTTNLDKLPKSWVTCITEHNTVDKLLNHLRKQQLGDSVYGLFFLYLLVYYNLRLSRDIYSKLLISMMKQYVPKDSEIYQVLLKDIPTSVEGVYGYLRVLAPSMEELSPFSQVVKDTFNGMYAYYQEYNTSWDPNTRFSLTILLFSRLCGVKDTLISGDIYNFTKIPYMEDEMIFAMEAMLPVLREFKIPATHKNIRLV